MQNLKLKRSDYRSVKISSDLHYGHDKDFVWGARGFKNAGDHQQWIFEKFSSLHKDDLLILLGDIGLSIGPQPIIELLNAFPCRTLMVWGNHNSGVRQLYRSHLPDGFEDLEIYPLRIGEREHITMLGDEACITLDWDKFYIRHMAPLIWPDNDRGRVAFCGHSHGNLIGINPGHSDYGQILDVGVDNALLDGGEPWFEISRALQLVRDKTQVCLDHH